MLTYKKRRGVEHPGTKSGVVNTALGRLSILICFDAEQADLIDEAVKAGAWLILNPSLVGPADTLELVEWRIAGQANEYACNVCANVFEVWSVLCSKRCRGRNSNDGYTRLHCVWQYSRTTGNQTSRMEKHSTTEQAQGKAMG